MSKRYAPKHYEARRVDDIADGPDPDIDPGPAETPTTAAEADRLLATEQPEDDWNLVDNTPRETDGGCLRRLATPAVLGAAAVLVARRRRRTKATRRNAPPAQGEAD